jgi:hypothetical protein
MSEVNRFRVNHGAIHRDWPPGESDVVMAKDHDAAIAARDKTIANFDFDVCPRLEARVRELEAALRQWEARCTGRNGSQSPCYEAALSGARTALGTSAETRDKCVKCGILLPPLEQWSMPACPTCTAAAETPAEPVKPYFLPKITPELSENFGDTCLMRYGAGRWDWTQEAVDFACELNIALSGARTATDTEGGK